ncbi:SCO family protein [Flavobacterium sp. '19STA2R22 D10 B1']|uniref:SCO family protein n=1 Tax=Flavobacterium aerium TaxID=3037261 RepID=UPI00278BCC98|nr:SCO family protein [Flavobacterium sp. '19STA2R22 D10 B1']
MKKWIGLSFVFLTALFSCQKEGSKLPYLGNTAQVKESSGIQGRGEGYFKVLDFEFLNQEGIKVNNETFKNKIYVADFMFLKCPTICPVMNTEMKRVYDVYKKNDKVLFVSHTIDPDNDSIPALKSYAEHLGVDSRKWHFLYGAKKDIYTMAEKGYFAQAYEDEKAPGGYAHSGGFLLIDSKRHIRGVYDGTNPTDVDRLIKEIVILLQETPK